MHWHIYLHLHSIMKQNFCCTNLALIAAFKYYSKSTSTKSLVYENSQIVIDLLVIFICVCVWGEW